MREEIIFTRSGDDVTVDGFPDQTEASIELLSQLIGEDAGLFDLRLNIRVENGNAKYRVTAINSRSILLKLVKSELWS